VPDVFEEEKAILPVFAGKGRPKKAKNTFDKEWAAKLAESVEGSVYN